MILDKESEDCINEVIQDFQTTPSHSRYHHVIKPPIVKKDLPPVFMWSPTPAKQQYRSCVSSQDISYQTCYHQACGQMI